MRGARSISMLAVLLGGCAELALQDGSGGPPSSTPSPSQTLTPTPTPSASASPTPSGIFLVPGQHMASSSAQTVTVTLPAPTTHGDLLLVVVGMLGAGAPTITDDKNDSFTLADNVVSPGGRPLALYFVKDTPAGATSVTAADASSFLYLEVAEFAGASLTAPLDGHFHLNGNSATPSCGGFTPSTTGDVVFVGELADTAPSVTPGTGYSLLDEVALTADEYQVTPSLAAVSATFDYPSSAGWGCVAAAFKP